MTNTTVNEPKKFKLRKWTDIVSKKGLNEEKQAIGMNDFGENIARLN